MGQSIARLARPSLTLKNIGLMDWLKKTWSYFLKVLYNLALLNCRIYESVHFNNSRYHLYSKSNLQQVGKLIEYTGPLFSHGAWIKKKKNSQWMRKKNKLKLYPKKERVILKWRCMWSINSTIESRFDLRMGLGSTVVQRQQQYVSTKVHLPRTASPGKQPSSASWIF